MKDYSLGNFISALREKKGLSQYQLGALVGVTDKAVSKWENGASKPRINTVKKLAQVLDVGIDELLTCEYATFGRKRKDLFAMKNDILKIAEERVKEIYGENPPLDVVNRFQTEELLLEDREILLWMGFFGKLQEVFEKDNGYALVRGGQLGASFIAWILGGTIVNPLPAHYYCPACKKMEFFKETKCGIDLPDKKCSCGEKLKKDGFGIATVNIFPLRKWMEITVSKNGTGLVKKCLDNYFKEYGVVREVIISNNVKGEDAFDRFNVKRYMVVSEELNKRFPEKIVRLSFEEYYNTAHDILGITVVEADKSVEFKYVDIEFSKKQIKEYYNYAKENDIFDDPVRNIHLPKILADIKEPSFGDLVAINGFLHVTGVWENNAEYLYKKGIPLQDMIYCCEDVYSYLYDKLKGVNSDNLSGLICEIKNSVCKGKYLKNTMPQEIEKLLDENEVPEWYIESMKKIRYLFPKAHIIASLKKDIEEFLILEKNRKLY